MDLEDFNDTIYKLYDIGLTEPSALNADQTHAFYYLDFTYAYEMGGFLYNTSPATSGDNFFKPYVDCWRFFGLNDLADKVEAYQNLYVKALRTYEEKPQADFKIIMQDIGLDKLGEELERYIELVYEQKKTWKWFQDNVDRLRVR